MKSIIPCFLIFSLSINLLAQQDSYIQVKAEPNIIVFLNGEFKGKTNIELGGLIIERLDGGRYNIKVVKDGYSPQTESITLKSGEVFVYKVKPFTPQYKITQRGNEQKQTIELRTGNLIIQSLPVEIQIEITDLGINSSKTQDEWRIADIPIGMHKAKFTWRNKVLIDTVRIEQGALKHLFVNLISGKIEIRNNENSEVVKSDDLINNDNYVEDPDGEIFVVVTEMPAFPGGDGELLKFINSNLVYPEIAKENNIQGRVIARFCVTSKGNVSQVSIIKGVDPSIDAEAIRVLKALPKWIPGKQDGVPVNVWYTVPVTFQLN